MRNVISPIAAAVTRHVLSEEALGQVAEVIEKSPAAAVSKLKTLVIPHNPRKDIEKVSKFVEWCQEKVYSPGKVGLTVGQVLESTRVMAKDCVNKNGESLLDLKYTYDAYICV